MDSYKNDNRLLDVFYMLVKRVDNPLVLFDNCHQKGFAKENADYYILWSNYRLYGSSRFSINWLSARQIIYKGIPLVWDHKVLRSHLKCLKYLNCKSIVNLCDEECYPYQSIRARNEIEMRRIYSTMTPYGKHMLLTKKYFAI